jgi:hypothetical protein
MVCDKYYQILIMSTAIYHTPYQGTTLQVEWIINLFSVVALNLPGKGWLFLHAKIRNKPEHMSNWNIF